MTFKTKLHVCLLVCELKSKQSMIWRLKEKNVHGAKEVFSEEGIDEEACAPLLTLMTLTGAALIALAPAALAYLKRYWNGDEHDDTL